MYSTKQGSEATNPKSFASCSIQSCCCFPTESIQGKESISWEVEKMSSCVYPADAPIGVLKQIGGNPEGGRMAQILEASKRCQVNEAIAKARALNSGGSCCPPTPVSRKQVPLESTALEGQLAACARINAQQASQIASQPLRGVPESVRIAQLTTRVLEQYSPYSDSNRRFLEYQGPVIPPVCPPLPTEITNAHLPKPSTRCDTLALLATGVPPNSIAR